MATKRTLFKNFMLAGASLAGVSLLTSSIIACCGYVPPTRTPRTPGGRPGFGYTGNGGPGSAPTAVSSPGTAPAPRYQFNAQQSGTNISQRRIGSRIRATAQSQYAKTSGSARQQQAASRRTEAASEEPGMIWQYSIVDAQRLAFDIDQAFVIYFCSEGAGKLAGEGPTAWANARRDTPDDVPPPTIFENSEVLKAFEKANINIFVKIPRKPENAEIFKSYGVELNTLLFCAPNGDRLVAFGGMECNDKSVTEFLQSQFEDRFGRWQRQHSLEAFDKKKVKIQGVKQVDDNRVWNVWRFNDKLMTGARLWDEECYDALAEMGVRTLIQVGANPPDLEMAKAYGMRYVHIPLAYGGITEKQAMLLAKAVRELPGPIYMHCNCGIHRSPAAAAIACIGLGLMDPEQGVRAMEKIGCDPYYKGLYDAVRNAKRFDPAALESLNMKFAPKSDLEFMVQAMVEWGQTWERMETAQNIKWNVPADQKDVNPPADTKKLLEQYLAMAKTDEGKAQPDGWRKHLADGEAIVKALHDTVKDWKPATAYPAAQVEAFDKAFRAVVANCNVCHKEFRDQVKPGAAQADAEAEIGPRKK